MNEKLKKITSLKQTNYMIVNYKNLVEIASLATETLENKEQLEKLKKEVGIIIPKIAKIYQDYEIDINEFLIRTDGALGTFLLDSKRTTLFKGIDAYISYENIISAYLNAVTTNNHKIANKIEPLLKTRKEGFINELTENYDYSLLEYIYLNGNLESFIKGETQDTITYFLYENENFTLIKVPKSRQEK